MEVRSGRKTARSVQVQLHTVDASSCKILCFEILAWDRLTSRIYAATATTCLMKIGFSHTVTQIPLLKLGKHQQSAMKVKFHSCYQYFFTDKIDYTAPRPHSAKQSNKSAGPAELSHIHLGLIWNVSQQYITVRKIRTVAITHTIENLKVI